MKTKEQFFKEDREEEKIKAEERRIKWRNEILEEIKDWDTDKLIEEYILTRLARISYSPGFPVGVIWDMIKDECRFCGLEYSGEHESCCDDCWEENKAKTLEELE